MTISKRIPVFVGGLALALAAVIFASDAAQAQTATCGALSSGAATCDAQTYGSGIRYDAGNGWNDGIAGPVTITVTGTTGATTTITAPSSPPNTYTDGAIVIRTAPQGTSDSTLRTVVLTVGSGSNAVAIVEDATETNHGVQVHQFGKAADATTVTVGSGVDIGTSMAPMRQYGVFVLATEGTNTATQKIDSAATIHSTEFGLLMDARGAGDTEVINSGSITTAATGGNAGNKSGIRILDWSHNPPGNSFGGDSRTASTTTTVTNSGTVTVSGQYAHGVHVAAEGLGLYKTVNSGTVSASGAGGHGILVVASYHTGAAGTTAVEIENSGRIAATGTYGDGINVDTNDGAVPQGRSDANLAITNSGAISAGRNGILVNSNMGGTTVKHTGGSIASTAGEGIRIQQGGTGTVTVESGADVTAKNHGIFVFSNPSTAATVTIAGGMTTRTAAVAIAGGATTTTYATLGDVSVTHSGGDIAAETESGIWVRQAGADATVTSSADITARKYGILVVNDPALATVAIAAGVTTRTWSNTGAVSVTHSGGDIKAKTESGIYARNSAGNADAVTVTVTGGSAGGSVSTEGQSKAAVAVLQRGTGDAVASVSSGAMLTSKHNAGIYATLSHAANAAGQVKIAQGGTIAARKGVYARVGRASAAGETRDAMKPPAIDVTWTGSFSHGTTATVAEDDDERFLPAGVAHAVAIAQEVETEKAIRYGQAAGIEAQVMSWRDVMTQVARGDDPGEVTDAAAMLAGDGGAAIRTAFRAVLANVDLDTIPGASAIDTDGTTGLSNAEIDTYLTANPAVLRNVLAQGFSEAEKAVLRAVVTDTGLTEALAGVTGASDAWKGDVRALLNRHNVGDVRVAMTGGSIASRGDGIRAYYATPHDRNGAIGVSVAEDATVTGANAGIYVANAGMGAERILKQSVTVDGMVTGGTDAAVHLVGGGTLTVGSTGKVHAGSSGRAVLVNDPGRAVVTVLGEVRGGEGAPAAVDLTGGGRVVIGSTGRVMANGATRAIQGDGEGTTEVIFHTSDLSDKDALDAAFARAVEGGIDEARPVASMVNAAGMPTGSTQPLGLSEDGTPNTDPFRPAATPGETPPPSPQFRCDTGAEARCRLYGALPSVLLAMNELPSLDERLSAPRDGRGAWARVEAASGQWTAAESTQTGLSYDHDRYGVRGGVDVASGDGVRLGLSMHGLRGSAEVASGGEVELSGVGLGASATRLFGGGFHMDAQAAATWYDVDLSLTAPGSTGQLSKDGTKGLGYAVGVEIGRRAEMNGVSVTPRAGLAWSAVSLSDFVARDDATARLSLDDAESLTGRAGLSVESEASAGVRLFGSVDVTHEFSEETEAMVSGTRLAASAETTGVRLGIGGLFDLGNGASLRGSAGYTSSGSDNSAYGGGLGVTMSF